MSWDPTQYLQFAGERLRPALDLLARIPIDAPETVIDLGCGAGNVTQMIGARWPAANIVGIDNDDAMLARARASNPDTTRIRFEHGDLETFRAAAPVDVLYSNAALHWLDDHPAVFARIAECVRPGGVLAVQMPHNFAAPSHTAVADLAVSPRYRDQIGGLVRARPVAEPASYFEWLSPWATSLDIWETEYLQVLAARADGAHPIVEWTKGTWLVPFLAALREADAQEFLVDYTSRVREAYPLLADGRVLFPFRRLFIIAKR